MLYMKSVQGIIVLKADIEMAFVILCDILRAP
jgi:hypothetical protein